MLRLFRDIRRRLIVPDNIRKYLLYAVGEIFLVVIGILIALQVNNWNQSRLNRIQEQTILKNLQKEIETNLRELDRDHALNHQALLALRELLDTDKRTSYSTSEIDSLIGTAYNFATFDARTGVIEEIIASGNLTLIQDEDLKYMISQWSGELNDLKEDVIIRRDYWLTRVSPLFNKYIPIRNTENTQVRNDYERSLWISPVTVSTDNYTRFINSMEIDGAIYNFYVNQAFVYSNEENIERYLNEFYAVLKENIHD